MSGYTGQTPDTEPARSWLLDALCARPEFAKYRDHFFPQPSEKATTAKAICAACPVRQACLDDAIREEGGKGHESRHGIRGGLGPRGRRNRYDRLRQQQRTAA